MKKYVYSIKILKIVDGDTIDAEIDLGFYTKVKKRIRLYGINTPETRLQSKIKNLDERKAEKERGLLAKARLREICQKNEILLESVGLGKYGRVLGKLYFAEENEYQESLDESINSLLVSEGLAEPYGS